MTEPFILEVAVRGFLEPIGKRSTYTASRLAILADGTTTPVLILLAKARFPNGWPEDQFPFWLDGDRQNETVENVGLAVRRVLSKRKRPGQKNAFGAPAGSKQYMQRWREENRERIRETQKRYLRRRKDLVAAVEARDVEDDPLLRKLEKIVVGGKNV